MNARPLLLVPLAALALSGSGCSRLLQAVFAPQSTVADTASRVADAASGQSNSLNRMGQEVSRFNAAGRGDLAEMQRLGQELERRQQAGVHQGPAQSDPARRVPWDARAGDVWPPEDQLTLPSPVGREPPLPRGLATLGLIPDGIAPGGGIATVDLRPIRLDPRQDPPPQPKAGP